LVEVIQGDIRPVAEFDHPLAELWRHFFDWATHLWVLAQRFDALPDRSNSTLGGVTALWF
jgi:hypothetical protein